MHLHILGIGGTFMSALALFARAKGFTVTGNDSGVYPPISDLLLQEGIAYHRNYEDMQAMLAADLVVVGNAMKRGMPIVEALLNHSKSYVSGPEWLAQHVLKDYRVLAVAGTFLTNKCPISW
jgi:UDP-N-acetylmuramate: L-alanyl-gamma-D-glutamyl-meso-diaminopimelate ligase